jgi:hypothetical protein
MKTPIAIAALVVASISLTALPALAQDAPTTPQAPAAATPQPPAPPAPGANTPRPPLPGQHAHRLRQPMGPMGGGMANRRFGLIALACSEKGPAVLERVLDRSAKRLALSADQQKLFDAFRTKALTAETTFSDACKAARPDKSATTRPDLLTRMKSGLAVDQARLTALNSVLPEFEALYNSLSDQQKHDLLPRQGMGFGRNWNQGPGNGAGHFGRGHHNAPQAPQNS